MVFASSFCLYVINRSVDIDNIDTQFLFTGSKDEFWFDAVTWQLEMNAVPGIRVSYTIAYWIEEALHETFNCLNARKV